MSYQQVIRDVLSETASELGRTAAFDVVVAKPGSFDMKVTLTEGASAYQQIFDLSNGLTPRTARAIRIWCRQTLSLSGNKLSGNNLQQAEISRPITIAAGK